MRRLLTARDETSCIQDLTKLETLKRRNSFDRIAILVLLWCNLIRSWWFCDKVHVTRKAQVWNLPKIQLWRIQNYPRLKYPFTLSRLVVQEEGVINSNLYFYSGYSAGTGMGRHARQKSVQLIMLCGVSVRTSRRIWIVWKHLRRLRYFMLTLILLGGAVSIYAYF